MRRLALKVLSAILLLLNIVASPIFAEELEIKETSDLTAIGPTNPLTEEELRIAIQPLEDYDEDSLFAMEDLREMATELYDLMVERQAADGMIGQEEIQEAYDEPTDISQAGSSEFYKYIAVEDLIMFEVLVQFYDNGDGYFLSNIEIRQTIPKSYEALEITAEELEELVRQAQDMSDFVQVLGHVHQSQFTLLSSGVLERASWIDAGHPWRDPVDTTFRIITIENQPGQEGFSYAVREISPSNEEEE